MNKNHLAAGVLSAALALPMSASAITIDGITFDAGAVLSDIFLREAEKFVGSTGNQNGLIDLVGEELIGVGRIDSIEDSTLDDGDASGGTYWADGDNGRELHAVFDGFVAEQVAGNQIEFSGGTVSVYSNAIGATDIDTGTQAARAASVASGTLWLELEAVTLLDGFTLHAFPSGLGGVGGFGFLNVTGGLAAAAFDTNFFTQPIVGLLGCDPTLCGPAFEADMDFSSSGSLGLPNPDGFPFEGGGRIRTLANPIPEPMTTALMGLGLLGMGVVRRKRS